MKHPRRYRPFLRRFAALALAGALCSVHAGGPGETNPETAMTRVRALIGAAGCESDAQCRSIGIGAKACGGPEFYLAWSIAATDEAALLREVAAVERAEQRAARRDGRASTCSIVPDPGATCAAPKESAPVAVKAPRHCQLRAATAGGGGAAR